MTAWTEEWRPSERGHEAWFEAGSHAGAAGLATALVALLPAGFPVPDMDVRRTGIRVGVARHPEGDGVRQAISAAAPALGLAADPRVLQRVGLLIDSVHPDRLMPFWQATAHLADDGQHTLADDLRRRPPIRLLRSARTNPLRNRVHLDVGLPGPNDEARSTALSTGGRETLVSQWYSTLADPDGNEVDVVPGGRWDGGATTDWHTLFGAMVCYPTDSADRAAEFAATAARLADAAGIDLMIDLRPVGVVLDSGKDRWEEIAGFTDLAGAIQTAAGAAGLVPSNQQLRFAQIALDAVDILAVREFWRAVLGYEHAPNLDYFDLFDPRQLGPVLFFQRMEATDVERLQQPGRIRLELQVPADQLETRIDTALAAAGRVVERDPAGRRHLLADPEGNELVLLATNSKESGR